MANHLRAMVLAAGMGTRLRPLTDARPKALVQLNGRSLLQIALARLRSVGVTHAIVNVHHFAEQVIAHLAENHNFGMEIAISREEQLLDTGGGLKNAAWFFAESDGPFLLHNVDILSDFDLRAMLLQHRQTQALATLAVQARSNTRPLLFNSQGQLRGYCRPGQPDVLVPQKACVPQPLRPLAFAGIHVLSPAIFASMAEQGAFSIIPCYLRMAAAGLPIMAFEQNSAYWRDLGTAASLQQAEADVAARPHLLAGLPQ